MNQGQNMPSLKPTTNASTCSRPNICLRLNQDQTSLGNDRATDAMTNFSTNVLSPSTAQTLEGERWEHQQTRAWLHREMLTTRWLQEERAKILQSREQWVEAWTSCNYSLVQCDTERVALAQQRATYMQMVEDLRRQVRDLRLQNHETRTRADTIGEVESQHSSQRRTLQERRIRHLKWIEMQQIRQGASTAEGGAEESSEEDSSVELNGPAISNSQDKALSSPSASAGAEE
ncbi:hypothetical protein BDV97DRAFT_147693 [Delphinella strobiligena]|nr:hypothetical protein BDV97DRAFT_147693 [Delphinella strobiligena]